MRLRYKLNLVACGFAACGALVGAMAHAALILSFCLVMTGLNWIIALKGEKKDATSK